MDYKVTWSPEALEYIDNIAEFHAKTDPLYAQVVVEDLITKSRKLDRFPLRGRKVPELPHLSYHEVFAYSYRLIYRVYEHQVIIVAAIPGKMPMELERFDASND